MSNEIVPVELLIEELERELTIDNRPFLELPLPSYEISQPPSQEKEDDPRGVVIIEL